MNPNPADLPVTVITPPKGWQIVDFKELREYRDLFYFLVWRDIKILYAQTILGEPFAEPYQLFDLSQDISETSNLAQSHPEVVKRLLAQFERISESGRSRP